MKIHQEIKKSSTSYNICDWYIFSDKNRSAELCISNTHSHGSDALLYIVYMYFPRDSTAITTVCVKFRILNLSLFCWGSP